MVLIPLNFNRPIFFKMIAILKIEQMKRVTQVMMEMVSLELMSNSCNPTSTLSNTTEIVENERPIKLSPLLWNSFQ